MNASAALVKVLREEGPRVIATLVRQLGDLSVAEDALSEATIAALGAWPESGIPDNPRAWLTVVARRKALDLLRRESARTGKETAAFRWGTAPAKDEMEEVIEAMETESELRDDMLRLIFTCCHPALGREAQVALALRTLARLEVDAIARAFLVPEATMAKRLVRARSKIATAHIPYAIPSDAELPDRLAAVLAVVYLIATEAHAPTGGTVVARVDLEAEAVRLARLLVELMPDEPEALSLLALLLFTSARTPARSDADGNAVTLADQDRGRWNREAITRDRRGCRRLSPCRAVRRGLTSFRPTCPQPTPPLRAGPTQTGTGSSGSTTCSGRSEPTRSWPSTGPSPSPNTTAPNRAGRAGGHRRPGAVTSVACRSGRQPPTARPDGGGGRRAGNGRRVGAHRGRTAAASVPSPRREVRNALTNSGTADVLWWYRRSSLHRTRSPIWRSPRRGEADDCPATPNRRSRRRSTCLWPPSADRGGGRNGDLDRPADGGQSAY